MIVSIRAAKKVTVHRFAKAAVVAAFLSALGATQGMGDMTMPENCAKYLQQCSLKVWPRDSFAHEGDTHSVTFSNGRTLTCTSQGHDKPRDCKITAGPEQCAQLKQELRDLEEGRRYLERLVGEERAYLEQVMQMTPARLDDEILRVKARREARRLTPNRDSPENVRKEDNIDKKVLNFLMDLRANQALGPEVGVAPTKKMEARSKQIVNDQQNLTDDRVRTYSKEIQKLNDQYAKLNCDQVPSVDQSVPGEKSGR